MDKKNIRIFAMAAHGTGISGGDRIFIEFARRWSINHRVIIYISKEGNEMLKRQKLTGKNLEIRILNVGPLGKLGFFINYFIKIFRSIFEAFKISLDKNQINIIYSASEFWMDSLPSLVLKLRHPKSIWSAAWYQTAPNPLKGFYENGKGSRYKISAFYYWFMQLPIKPLIGKYADFVLVNNVEEKRVFFKLNRSKRVGIVLGAVNIESITEYKELNKNEEKKYDAIFQGRFHPQKGVVELIDIWGKVVDHLPNAKLAMIGDGPLIDPVKLRIAQLKLEKSIKLFGYLFDGSKKYQIFNQSKLVVHPAFYDSGGMAAAEAMAFSIPVVGFDLKSYKSYYPRGMVKAKVGSLDDFARIIVKLLKDNMLRKKIGEEALEMIKNNWSWDLRSEEILSFLTSKK